MKFMKKLTAAALGLTLAVGFLTACTKAPAETPDVPAQLPELTEVYDAVKEAYGEDYLPSMEVDEDTLCDMLGLEKESISAFFGEMPMMSTHVDTFIGIRAAEGKGDEVEKAVNDYRETQVSNTLQYPMNLAKVQASKVVRHGDDVYFVMLGKINDNMDVSEEEGAKFAEEQVKIGTDAIDAMYAQ